MHICYKLSVMIFICEKSFDLASDPPRLIHPLFPLTSGNETADVADNADDEHVGGIQASPGR